MDEPSPGPITRFWISSRPGLWPAIIFSAYAFSYILSYNAMHTAILAVSLCLIASVGFLFNDTIDRTIDEANNVHRWCLQTHLDLLLFCSAVSLNALSILISFYFLGTVVGLSLLGTFLLVGAYSLFLKKIPLLGNVVAAALSITPGLIMLLDVRFEAAWVDLNSGTTATLFLIIGFLLLLSREIKFDEFDEVGDRIGGRTTIPMLFDKRSLGVVYVLLNTIALALFIFAVATRGDHPLQINVRIAILITTVIFVLMISAYRSASKTMFYKTTRLVMFLIPLSIFFSF